jgi:heme/copper-type cytochrome/quinol oxidase subunit 1
MNGKRESRVTKIAIIAWIISFAGMALWLYGYFTAGNPSLIDWHAYTPWWIADFLPNIEAEIGMALACVGTVLGYWPSKR